MAGAEPGSTTYQRDLSISYDQLFDLAREAGQVEEAKEWVSQALRIRRRLVRAEPGRLDLAEELTYTLYLSTTDAGGGDDLHAKQEATSLLEPFGRRGPMTPRASALLAWARDTR